MPTKKKPTRKKAPAKKPAPPERVLTPVEEFYILKNYHKEGPSRLSQLMGVPEPLIAAYVAANKSLFEGQQVNPLPGTNFAADKGTVSMTSSQSQKDDEDAEKARKVEGGRAFMDTLKSNIHVIDPSLPVK